MKLIPIVALVLLLTAPAAVLLTIGGIVPLDIGAKLFTLYITSPEMAIPLFIAVLVSTLFD